MSRVAAVWVFVILAVLSVAIASPAFASVNNFTITDYTVDMTLGRDDDKRSTLRVTETITADFPPNQNRGLERVFAKTYQGRSTSFTLESVTDEHNNKRNYHWSGDALRIGDKDVYVSGNQTYRITYTQRDVTRAYDDTSKDEFYWDVIGASWRVPIYKASVQLRVDSALVGAIQTDMQCYTGYHGSTDTCIVQNSTRGEYSAVFDQLRPREGVTFALGFTPSTFAGYQPGLWWWVFMGWLILQAVLIVVAIGLSIYLAVRRQRAVNRTSEQHPITTEYLPPRGITVTTAAALMPGTRSRDAAQLLDLAVRHVIKLYQLTEAKWYRSAEYEIEILQPIDQLPWEEQELLSDKFGRMPRPGDRLKLSSLRNNQLYQLRLMNNATDLEKKIRGDYGLRAQDEQLKQSFRRWGWGLLAASLLTMSPSLFLAMIVAFTCSANVWRLTDRGLVTLRHLRGLKQYISIAETDRLAALQSPDGAAKVAEVVSGVDTPQQRVVLYERVLPYAVLFGQEKQWNQQLGDYYQQAQTQPDWYAGTNTGVFNAVALGSAVNSFSSATASANSFSDSSSSSSGGSSGGGFSGGGGGGGGGGGW